MQLPVELLVRILQNVDGRDLWIFRRVCKRWYELLGDLQVQRMLLPGLSWNQPFEHVKALSLGMPYRVSHQKLGGSLHRPTLHEHLLMFDEYDATARGRPLKLKGTVSLDLRTGEMASLHAVHTTDGYADLGPNGFEQMKGAPFALTAYDGTVCRWTEEGIETISATGTTVLHWAFSSFERYAMAMDSQYVFLFGIDKHFSVFRIDRVTNERHHFSFAGQGCTQSSLEVKPAGPLQWMVGWMFLYLGARPTMQPIYERSQAVWRNVVYELRQSRPLQCPWLQASRLLGPVTQMGRISELGGIYFSVNDHYMVACDGGVDRTWNHVTVFHMNPDSRLGQPIHRSHPRKTMNSLESGLELSEPSEQEVFQAKWVPISTDYICPFGDDDKWHLPVTLLT